MKLNTSLAIDSSSVGFGNAKSFGFEMNAMAFNAVIDGIYSDKIESPVREICTNAFDAHIMVDTPDRPFEIQAPSNLNPFFRVRDFGPGMTDDEIRNRATTMFASNKRDSNNQVGMLGLGMKSPFAYTNLYTITAFDGRTKRVYNCFLDEGSMPTVASLPVEICNNPAGIEISFPVKAHDVHRFQIAIAKVMIGFDPQPQVVNDLWKPQLAKTTLSGPGWKMVQHDSIKKPFVRQGCVLYPLDLHQIRQESDRWDVYSLQQIPLIIDMPIGTVSVSTSREQIGYDAETVANLRAAFLQVLSSAKADMEASFDAYDDFHDACTAYATTPDVLFKLTGYGKTKWRGKFDLRKSFTISGRPTARNRACLVDPDKVAFISREVKDIDPQALKGGVVLCQDDDLKHAGLRVRAYVEANFDRPVIWAKDEAGEAVAADLGLTEVIELATIEPLKIERTKSGPRFQRSDLRTFSEHRHVVRGHDLDAGGIFVMTNGASYVWGGKTQSFKHIDETVLRLARKQGFLPRWDETFALLQTQRNIPTKHRGWVSLEDHLKAQVKHFDPKVYAEQMGFLRLSNSGLWSSVLEFRDQLPKRLLAFINKVEANNVRNEVYTHELQVLWRRLHDQPEIKVDDTLPTQFAKLMENYPLWEELDRAYGDHRRALLTNYCTLLRK